MQEEMVGEGYAQVCYNPFPDKRLTLRRQPEKRAKIKREERRCMTVPVPMCFFCRHLHEESKEEGALSCDAYPARVGGIPMPILQSLWDHRLPFPYEREVDGVLFELKEGADPKDVPFLDDSPDKPIDTKYDPKDFEGIDL